MLTQEELTELMYLMLFTEILCLQAPFYRWRRSELMQKATDAEVEEALRRSYSIEVNDGKSYSNIFLKNTCNEVDLMR